ncbi:MAG TPA: hypothetical protein VGM73_02765 [Candidatus Didemnitutus sp.]
MNSILRHFITIAILAGSVTLRADPAPTPASRELTVTFVDNLSRSEVQNFYFDRLDIALHKAIAKRKWPVTLHVERFAAGTPAAENEMQIFFKGIRPEERDDLTFRAWVTFSGPAGKQDFGIIRYQYYPRATENMDDSVTKIMRAAVDLALDKIEPLLFPQGSPAKS